MKYNAEKDLSTKKVTPPEEARLPEPQCYKDRKESPQGKKIEGTLAPYYLKTPPVNSPPEAGQSASGGHFNDTVIHETGQHASARWGRKRRIRARREFNEIYAHGKNFNNSLVVLKFLPNRKGYSRAAFSVGKKLDKAAGRNRVKRLMREALRSLEVKSGWDLLFISRTPMMNSNFHQVRESLEKVLEKAGLLSMGNSDSAK